jgi:hypothetical protein
MNDLFQIGFRGALQLYADDAVLTHGEASVEELEWNIKHDLNLLHTWLAAVRLSMNISKTRFRVRLFFVLLNINTWDSRLNWSSHSGHIMKKISPYIGVFRRISSCVVPETILNLYFSMCIHTFLILPVFGVQPPIVGWMFFKDFKIRQWNIFMDSLAFILLFYYIILVYYLFHLWVTMTSSLLFIG